MGLFQLAPQIPLPIYLPRRWLVRCSGRILSLTLCGAKRSGAFQGASPRRNSNADVETRRRRDSRVSGGSQRLRSSVAFMQALHSAFMAAGSGAQRRPAMRCSTPIGFKEVAHSGSMKARRWRRSFCVRRSVRSSKVRQKRARVAFQTGGVLGVEGSSPREATASQSWRILHRSDPGSDRSSYSPQRRADACPWLHDGHRTGSLFDSGTRRDFSDEVSPPRPGSGLRVSCNR